MKEKIISFMESGRGMGIVNLLFFLSLLIRNRGIIFVTYALWITCLVYFIKMTSSKAVKIIDGVLIVLAVAVIAGNLYFMLS